MNTYKPVHISRQDLIQPGFTGQGFSPTPYPGLENLYDGFGGNGGNFWPAAQTPAESPSGGLLGNIPVKEIQGFITKMGGIDGIMGTMVKMQKFMQTFQQMGPMLKLLMSSFVGKSAKTAGSGEYRPSSRRRRRTNRRSNTYRRGKPTPSVNRRGKAKIAVRKGPYSRPSRR